MRSMQRPYQIFGVVLILFGLFMAQQCLRYKFYTPMGPGPGFFPLFVSLLIAFLGAAMLFQATFRVSDPMPSGFFATPSGYLRIGAIIVAFVAVVLFMEGLGFRLTMLGFLVFLLSTLGRQNVLVTGLVSLAGSFGTYYLFVKWLDVPLPTGIFGF